MNSWLSTLTLGLLLAVTGLFRQPDSPTPRPVSLSELTARLPICGVGHVGGIPTAVLRQPVALRTGLGAVPTPTSTQSPEAQAYFEQGMAYLHGYVWVEAARSFHQALRRDSTLALAHVQLSWIYSQLDDTTAARREARRAKALENFVSEREKAHVRIRFSHLRALDSLTNAPLLLAYRRDLSQAIRQFPNDVELWLLLGNAHERYADGRGQGSGPAVIAIYEKVLRLAPDHSAAHHYLIHANEGMMNYEQALVHGEVYARLAPNLPHAGHMYAHDLMKTGRVDEAIAYLTRADSIERRTFETEGYKPDFDWHHAHNLTLLALCYQYQGRLTEAETTLKRVYGMTRPGDPQLAYYTKKSYPELLLDLGRTAEVERLAQELTGAKTPGERLLGHYLLGLAHGQKREWESARREAEAASAELPAIRKANPSGWIAVRVEPYPKFLNALLALHGPNPSKATLDAVREFQKSAREQTGPDPWVEALFQLETLARHAREAGLTAFADESAQLLAKHDPGYAGTHYALAQLARQRGDAPTAGRELALAAAGWQRGDAAFRKRMGVD
jgi:tetratricopeptide (TPR) repeat protein